MQTEILAASRAEAKPGLNRTAAMRAQGRQRVPQEEIQDDAESIGNEDGQQRPKHAVHAPPPGIAIQIADEQYVAADE
jgi:hypothetical protein